MHAQIGSENSTEQKRKSWALNDRKIWRVSFLSVISTFAGWGNRARECQLELEPLTAQIIMSQIITKFDTPSCHQTNTGWSSWCVPWTGHRSIPNEVKTCHHTQPVPASLFWDAWSAFPIHDNWNTLQQSMPIPTSLALGQLWEPINTENQTHPTLVFNKQISKTWRATRQLCYNVAACSPD
jgi:hypothetical protein